MQAMKQTVALALLIMSLGLTQAHAQTMDPAPESEAPPAGEDSIDLMEEGARMLLRGLMSEMEPALDEMGLALREMEPAVRDLMTMIGDIRNYHAPQVMPNGDILIRKKTPAEIEILPEGEIEL